MKRFLRLVSLTLLIMSTSGNTFAEEKVNVARQGTIRGRIVDTSKQILPGASIYIEKLHTGVTSDVNGYYTFANLTPGTYTVKVSYVGYSPVEMKITIPAGKTLEKDVVLNEGLELQEVVVGGAFQGQRRAINSQKNNLGITNVVSADQVGKFPDSNIGDALKRINGINVQYDQGEARFGQVRGTSADLSSVTINGNRLPSAEGDSRAAQLDLIPTDMIQTIEVHKVVTADMDGDAIGGAVNLVTKNSPYRQTVAATAGAGYNPVSQRVTFNGSASWGSRFFNDKLGVMASLAYHNNPIGSDNIEATWKEDDTGNAYVDEFEIRQYYVHRERQSYSLSFDWKFNENHKIELRGMYNRRNGNNPAALKTDLTLGVIGAVSRGLRIGRLPVTLRWQSALPLVGALFSPEYDELYFEMYLGNRHGLVHCAWPGNFFRWDNLVTADIGLGNTALRLGFRSDIYSQKVNHIPTRNFSYAFVLGVVTDFISVSPRRSLPSGNNVEWAY